MFTCKLCKRPGLTTPADLPGGPICPRCADLLAQTAPRLLAACRAAEELLSRLWTPNAPTVAEIALLREVRWRGSARDLALVTLLLQTGLRVSEACKLALEDIDLGERKGLLRIREGKGQKERVVPLNSDARRALQVYLAGRPAAGHRRVFVGQVWQQIAADLEVIYSKRESKARGNYVANRIKFLYQWRV